MRLLLGVFDFWGEGLLRRFLEAAVEGGKGIEFLGI